MESFEVNFLLKKNGSSQTDIAQQLKISPRTVNNVINNRTRSARVAKKIASTIKLPLEHVFPQYEQAA